MKIIEKLSNRRQAPSSTRSGISRKKRGDDTFIFLVLQPKLSVVPVPIEMNLIPSSALLYNQSLTYQRTSLRNIGTNCIPIHIQSSHTTLLSLHDSDICEITFRRRYQFLHIFSILHAPVNYQKVIIQQSLYIRS